MKISVVIIAHNEEKHIAQCIESILSQTVQADEIIVVVHNSTDNTLKIAERYPVLKVNFSGEKGILHARVKGLECATEEMILCIDGDSFAEKNWIEVMMATLQSNDNILVGSWVKFKGTIFGAISNIFNKPASASRNKNATVWLWGPSFGFWAKDKNKVIEILQKSILLSEQLQLSRNPEDYWLALLMHKIGNIEVTNKTFVTQHTKESSTREALLRNAENHKNGKLIRASL